MFMKPRQPKAKRIFFLGADHPARGPVCLGLDIVLASIESNAAGNSLMHFDRPGCDSNDMKSTGYGETFSWGLDDLYRKLNLDLNSAFFLTSIPLPTKG